MDDSCIFVYGIAKISKSKKSIAINSDEFPDKIFPSTQLSVHKKLSGTQPPPCLPKFDISVKR